MCQTVFLFCFETSSLSRTCLEISHLFHTPIINLYPDGCSNFRRLLQFLTELTELTAACDAPRASIRLVISLDYVWMIAASCLITPFVLVFTLAVLENPGNDSITRALSINRDMSPAPTIHLSLYDLPPGCYSIETMIYFSHFMVSCSTLLTIATPLASSCLYLSLYSISVEPENYTLRDTENAWLTTAGYSSIRWSCQQHQCPIANVFCLALLLRTRDILAPNLRTKQTNYHQAQLILASYGRYIQCQTSRLLQNYTELYVHILNRSLNLVQCNVSNINNCPLPTARSLPLCRVLD